MGKATLICIDRPWPVEMPGYVGYAKAEKDGKIYVYDAHDSSWNDSDLGSGVEDALAIEFNALIWF